MSALWNHPRRPVADGPHLRMLAGVKPLAIVVALGVVAMPMAAAAQQPPPTNLPRDNRAAEQEDPPLGAPYHAGRVALTGRASDVPLRDFLSKIIDSLRAEVLDRMDQQTRQLMQLINERDRQYNQRFDSQQEAVNTALESARVATDKAQEAADKRFDSVNEFRETLADQTREFIRRETFEASIGGLDARMLELSRQLDAVLARGEGAASLWGYLVGGFGVMMAIVIFVQTWVSRFSATPAPPVPQAKPSSR